MNGRSLTRALTTRAWAQQGKQALAIPAATALGIVLLLLVLPQLAPGGIHGTPSLPTSGPIRIATGHGSRIDAAMATALLIAPQLLALAASLTGLTVSRSILAPDISGGIAESLLATSLRPRAIFFGYATAAFTFSLLAWAVLAGTFLGLATAAVLLGGSTIHLTGEYFATALLIPLASMLWATSLLTFVAFARPAWLKVTAGLNGGPVRAAGILPTLGATVFLAAEPSAYRVFAWSYVGGCACASLALMTVLAALFNSERLLET